jgi:hypothetical protein
MKHEIFKPEDFECVQLNTSHNQDCSDIANKKLNKLIESGVLKHESSEQPRENTSKNKEVKDRMPRMVRIETWEW